MRPRTATAIAIATLASLTAPDANAARFTSAQITRAINDVRELLAGGTSRAADEGATLSGESSLLTGQKSRAELTFPDETIIRLGQNTAFSFGSGKRKVTLDAGTMLLQQPKWRGRTEIRTAAVSAAITGTSVLLESNPTHGKRGIEKLIAVEGSMRFSLNAAPKKSMTLWPGEMVSLPSDAKELPRKFVFDIGLLMKTSPLVNGGFRPLPRLDKMTAQATAQKADRRATGDRALFTRKPEFPLANIFGRHDVQEVRNRRPLPAMPPPVIRPPAPEPEAPPAPPPPPPDIIDPDRPGNGGDPGGGNQGGADPAGMRR